MLRAVRSGFKRLRRPLSTREIAAEVKRLGLNPESRSPNAVKKYLETLSKGRIRGARGFRAPRSAVWARRRLRALLRPSGFRLIARGMRRLSPEARRMPCGQPSALWLTSWVGPYLHPNSVGGCTPHALEPCTEACWISQHSVGFSPIQRGQPWPGENATRYGTQGIRRIASASRLACMVPGRRCAVVRRPAAQHYAASRIRANIAPASNTDASSAE